MRRNPAYFRTRTHGDSESIDGEDVEKRDRTQIHEDMVASVVEGMWSSDEGDEEDDEELSLDLSGLMKTDEELDTERRQREREDLAERIAEKLVEKTRGLDRRDTVSKEETLDPVESCERTLDILDELIARTEDGEAVDE